MRAADDAELLPQDVQHEHIAVEAMASLKQC